MDQYEKLFARLSHATTDATRCEKASKDMETSLNMFYQAEAYSKTSPIPSNFQMNTDIANFQARLQQNQAKMLAQEHQRKVLRSELDVKIAAIDENLRQMEATIEKIPGVDKLSKEITLNSSAPPKVKEELPWASLPLEDIVNTFQGKFITFGIDDEKGDWRCILYVKKELQSDVEKIARDKFPSVVDVQVMDDYNLRRL